MSRALREQIKSKYQSQTLVERYKILFDNLQEDHTCKKENDWIYLLYSPVSGLYKVGITGNSVYSRLNAICNASGDKDIFCVEALMMGTNIDPKAKIVESLVHAYFDKRRLQGEWFTFTKRDLVQLRQLYYAVEGFDCLNSGDFMTSEMYFSEIETA